MVTAACEIEPYPVGEGSALRFGLSGRSIVLRAGEMAPGRKGAGISEIMRSTSSSSSVLLCFASCSHERIEPRSFPGRRALGRKNGELSDEDG